MMAIRNMKFLVCLSLAVSIGSLRAQGDRVSYPVIGKPMPVVQLNNVHYYKTNSIDNSDLIGKWTIMDFWTKYCPSCVGSFSKLNALQQEFKDEIQFLLIGNLDHTINRNTDIIYERYRKTKDLKLTVAYDSAIFDQFGIYAVPHIVVVSPTGIVYAVTGIDFLTSETLDRLVKGNNPEFKRSYAKYEKSDEYRPKQWKYLFDEESRKDRTMYHSLLCVNKGELNAGFYGIDYTIEKGMFQHVRITLSDLYNIAYLGITKWNRTMPEYKTMYNEYWPRPIFETSDSSYAKKYNRRYNYQVVVPLQKASRNFLMKVMQDDLKKYFGYEVVLEKRMMPCWTLTATEAARKKLISKYSETAWSADPASLYAKKIRVGSILLHIESFMMSDQQIPLIDATGIDGFIDIEINAAMGDVMDVARELKKVGLNLEKGKKEMNVLVIRDSMSAKSQ